MSIDHPLGAPSWFELGTSDQAAAETFYSALFGWTQRKTSMPDGSHYTIFQLGDRDVAACYTLMADMIAVSATPSAPQIPYATPSGSPALRTYESSTKDAI